MTVQIDTTAENNGLRLVTQGGHPSAPSSGHILLYYVTGTTVPGLYTELSNGQVVGPFVTGTNLMSVTILPQEYTAASGTWTFNPYYLQNDTHANGNYLLFSLYLNAGTYTLSFYGSAFTDRPKVDFLIDGVTVGTIDMYSVSNNNFFTGVISNISVSTTGSKVLKLLVNGKNASSSDYYVLWKNIRLTQTA